MIRLQPSVPNTQPTAPQGRVAFKGEGDFLGNIDKQQLQAEKQRLIEFANEGDTPKIVGKVAKGVVVVLGGLISVAATRLCLNKSMDMIDGFIKSKAVKGVIDEAGKVVEKYKGPVGEAALKAVDVVKAEAKVVGAKIAEGASDAGVKAGKLADDVKKAATPIMDDISAKTKPLRDKFELGADKVSATFNELLDKFMTTKFGNKIKSVLGAEKTQNVIEMLKKGLNEVCEFFKKLFGVVTTGTKEAAVKTYDKMGEVAKKVTPKNVRNAVVNTAAVGAGASVVLTETGIVEKKSDSKSIVDTVIDAAAGGV